MCCLGLSVIGSEVAFDLVFFFLLLGSFILNRFINLDACSFCLLCFFMALIALDFLFYAVTCQRSHLS